MLAYKVPIAVQNFLDNNKNIQDIIDYDTSLFPSSEIVFVAKSQIGNEGGDKFWKWYGFEEHVHWCACFIYTIEGNTSNKCAERMYSFDDVQVMGYGSPKY